MNIEDLDLDGLATVDHKPPPSGNPEVDAMAAVDRLVFSLPPAAQDRVLAWATARRRDEKAEGA